MDNKINEKLDKISLPLKASEDLDPLMEAIGGAHIVLLGEASHGTREFYTWRKTISERLITEKGFSFIAVEGDWPECYQVNSYVKGLREQEKSPKQILQTFKRWPTWMWANEEIFDLVKWLKDYNHDQHAKIGFYGLDVYSLWESLDVVMDFVKKNHPDELQAILNVYRCFEPYARDAHLYAWASQEHSFSCKEELVNLLKTLRVKFRGKEENEEDFFNAEQNALVAKNSEDYYRSILKGDTLSWNVRDRHMTETLERLMRYHGKHSKAIVWAHNTHVGDARFTEMRDSGAINIGQLLREHHKAKDVFITGFSSYRGHAIAAENWGSPMEKMTVPAAFEESHETLLHNYKNENQLFIWNAENKTDPELTKRRGHRAIGVVYNPHHEIHNYVPTNLPNRYDALLHFDETEALNPLPIGEIKKEELMETYPSGL